MVSIEFPIRNHCIFGPTCPTKLLRGPGDYLAMVKSGWLEYFHQADIWFYLHGTVTESESSFRTAMNLAKPQRQDVAGFDDRKIYIIFQIHQI